MEYIIVNNVDVLISAIIIGFEETNYTVSESVGTLEVYVSVTSPPSDVELFATIRLGIQSVPRTASKYYQDCVEHNVNTLHFKSWRW